MGSTHCDMTQESGYTLVETLVAMVIFLTALVPLGFGIAAYLLDSEPVDLRESLLLATEEIEKPGPWNASEAICGKYTVKRELLPAGSLIEIRVLVVKKSKPNVVLVALTRMVEASP